MENYDGTHEEMYKVLMDQIHRSNYGIINITVDDDTLSFIEDIAGLLILDNETHVDYLFRIYDYYFDDSKMDEVL